MPSAECPFCGLIGMHQERCAAEPSYEMSAEEEAVRAKLESKLQEIRKELEHYEQEG